MSNESCPICSSGREPGSERTAPCPGSCRLPGPPCRPAGGSGCHHHCSLDFSAFPSPGRHWLASSLVPQPNVGRSTCHNTSPTQHEFNERLVRAGHHSRLWDTGKRKLEYDTRPGLQSGGERQNIG